ncbi:MAG: hypothetical protein ACYCPS_06235, partial [Candidatus Saccharimonadales bacterium]
MDRIEVINTHLLDPFILHCAPFMAEPSVDEIETLDDLASRTQRVVESILDDNYGLPPRSVGKSRGGLVLEPGHLRKAVFPHADPDFGYFSGESDAYFRMLGTQLANLGSFCGVNPDPSLCSLTVPIELSSDPPPSLNQEERLTLALIGDADSILEEPLESERGKKTKAQRRFETLIIKGTSAEVEGEDVVDQIADDLAEAGLQRRAAEAYLLGDKEDDVGVVLNTLPCYMTHYLVGCADSAIKGVSQAANVPTSRIDSVRGWDDKIYVRGISPDEAFAQLVEEESIQQSADLGEESDAESDDELEAVGEEDEMDVDEDDEDIFGSDEEDAELRTKKKRKTRVNRGNGRRIRGQSRIDRAQQRKMMRKARDIPPEMFRMEADSAATKRQKLVHVLGVSDDYGVISGEPGHGARFSRALALMIQFCKVDIREGAEAKPSSFFGDLANKALCRDLIAVYAERVILTDGRMGVFPSQHNAYLKLSPDELDHLMRVEISLVFEPWKDLDQSLVDDLFEIALPDALRLMIMFLTRDKLREALGGTYKVYAQRLDDAKQRVAEAMSKDGSPSEADLHTNSKYEAFLELVGGAISDDVKDEEGGVAHSKYEELLQQSTKALFDSVFLSFMGCMS